MYHYCWDSFSSYVGDHGQRENRKPKLAASAQFFAVFAALRLRFTYRPAFALALISAVAKAQRTEACTPAQLLSCPADFYLTRARSEELEIPIKRITSTYSASPSNATMWQDIKKGASRSKRVSVPPSTSSTHLNS